MTYMDKYIEWINNEHISGVDKNELVSIKDNPDEIKDRFYKDLEFGTGGLRGIIGIGSNRINIYTVRKATQGLASYLLKANEDATKMGVAIAYDSRNYSEVFATEAALVLAGNGIKTYLFESLRSTPELSFTVRHLGCACGIVITASHNPKEYNGYKVYNQYGGQITPNYAKGIISEINQISDWEKIKRMDETVARNKDLIQIIGNEVDEVYLKKVNDLILNRRLLKKETNLKIVYTPLHGTGLMPITKCLYELGYNDVNVVKAQAIPDGDFSTIKSPNPEEHEAFREGIELAEEINADIILGTDPDCDRIGVVVKNDKNEYQVLTGNQTGALLVDYILKSTEAINSNHAIIKTIVTSDLGAKIATSSGATVFETLTGFKYIGEKIQEFEELNSHEFLFGYEESYGYLAGTFVRDKDAVIACALIVEMTSYYKQHGKNLFEALQDIYKEYGYYLDDLETFTFEGADGQKKIQDIMNKLRKDGEMFSIFQNAIYIEDYKTKTTQFVDGSTKKNIQLPLSDVIRIMFDDDSWLAIRPSGTEPKLKVYYSIIGDNHLFAEKRLLKLKKIINSIIR